MTSPLRALLCLSRSLPSQLLRNVGPLVTSRAPVFPSHTLRSVRTTTTTTTTTARTLAGIARRPQRIPAESYPAPLENPFGLKPPPKNLLNLNSVASQGTDARTYKQVLNGLAASTTDLTPFVLVDLGDVYRKHLAWESAFPRIQPFYALKCNNDYAIGKSLASLGAGFDCASEAEIKQVLSYGISPKEIIYAHPCKPPTHIKFARDHGVEMMTFDNEAELAKIKAIHPHAKLVVRVHTGDSKAICKLGKKFGAPTSDMPDLLRAAKRLDLNVVGVSFHIGSGCLDATAFDDAIKIVRGVFDLAQGIGYNLDLVDVGGGFPGDSRAPVGLPEIAGVLNKSLSTYFPDPRIRVIAEPGRYYVASSTTLAVNLVSKRRIAPTSADEVPVNFYYVNDGTYGSLNNVMYDHANPEITTLRESYAGPTFSTTIWGPTCDSMDCITRTAQLPEVPLGDWLLVENAGAYTVAAGSTFNGFPRPKSHYTFSAPTSFDASVLPEEFPLDPEVFQPHP